MATVTRHEVHADRGAGSPVRLPPALARIMRPAASPGVSTASVPGDCRHHGISLFVVLVALTLLSLAAVGLIRLVDTGALVAGNLSFKQATTLAADRATEQAIAWIGANSGAGALYVDNATLGYYASASTALDPLGNPVLKLGNTVDWLGDKCHNRTSLAGCLAPGPIVFATTSAAPSASFKGLSAKILIQRMCAIAGDPDVAGNDCARPLVGKGSGAGYKGKVGYATPSTAGTEYGPYFRILVRAEGPRNTVSFTESMVHFPK